MIKVSKGSFTNAYCQFTQINPNVVPTVPDRRISKCSNKKIWKFYATGLYSPSLAQISLFQTGCLEIAGSKIEH